MWEKGLEHAGELLHERLEEHVDMLGGNVVDFKAAGCEGRPAESRIFALAENLRASIGSAHEGDLSGVRLKDVPGKGAAVGLVHEEVTEIERKWDSGELESHAGDVAAANAEMICQVPGLDGDLFPEIGQAPLAKAIDEACRALAGSDEGLMAGNKCVKQDDECGLDALGVKLSGHFKGNVAAKRSAADETGALGIEGSHLGYINGGKLIEGGFADVRAGDERRLEGKEGLVGAESFGELLVEEDISSDGVDAKERDAGAVGLNGYERGPDALSLIHI